MEYLDERAINIYTDGSSLPAPRRGGVGIVFVTEGANGHWQVDPFEVAGYMAGKNNQMERRACIEALHALHRGYAPVVVDGFKKVVIWTDSSYLIDGYHSARFAWPSNGWMTRTGNPVMHVEQWKELVKVANRLPLPVEMEWVNGHKSSVFNKQADKLAKASAKGHLKAEETPSKVRRKKSPYSVARGSVEMLGQQMTVRIIDETPHATHGMVRFKYEVMSKRSPYYQRVDHLWHEEPSRLRAGHVYRIRVNEDTDRPRIVNVFSEVAQGS